MKLPKNWPKGFQYSPVSVHVGVSSNIFRHLLFSPEAECQTKTAVRIETQTVHPHLAILKITEKLKHRGKIPHPLAGQYGVFAKKKIPQCTELGEYVGEIFFSQHHLEAPECYKGVHCWRASFGPFMLNISSERIANELAFINDFRGLKEEPNVRTKWLLHQGNYHFGFETIRQIEPMEELLIDYGKTWAKTRGIA